MRLTVLGCAWAAPIDGVGASGYLVEAGGAQLLVDCGPGVATELGRHGSPWRLDGVVVSHVHFDHCYDLLPLAWTRLARLAGAPDPTKLPLWLPPGGTQTLEWLGAAFVEHATEKYVRFHQTAFDTREYADAGAELRFGEATIWLFGPTAHPAPCYAIRIEAPDGVIAYSADGEACGAMRRAAEGADLFVCEATLFDEESRRPGGHMTVRDAAELAADAGVGALVLTHLPRFDESYTAAVQADAARWFDGHIDIAQPGLTCSVGRAAVGSA